MSSRVCAAMGRVLLGNRGLERCARRFPAKKYSLPTGKKKPREVWMTVNGVVVQRQGSAHMKCRRRIDAISVAPIRDTAPRLPARDVFVLSPAFLRTGTGEEQSEPCEHRSFAYASRALLFLAFGARCIQQSGTQHHDDGKPDCPSRRDGQQSLKPA